jgi:hypothetical protein
VKRIFRSLKEIIDFGIWYLNGNELTMVSYMDAHWRGIIDDKRSKSREYLYLGDFLVSCLRNKKYLVSLTTSKE